MGRMIDTLGCLMKIFIKQYVICMITPGMMEKCRKCTKPTRLQVHAFVGIVKQYKLYCKQKLPKRVIFWKTCPNYMQNW